MILVNDNEGYDKNCISTLTFVLFLYWSYCTLIVVQN